MHRSVGQLWAFYHHSYDLECNYAWMVFLWQVGVILACLQHYCVGSLNRKWLAVFGVGLGARKEHKKP